MPALWQHLRELQAGSAWVVAGRGPTEVKHSKGDPRFLLSRSTNGQVYQAPGPDGRGVKGQGGVRVTVGRTDVTVSHEKWIWGLRTTWWEGQE